MSINFAQENMISVEDVCREEREELGSFGEFVKSTCIGLGAVLLVSIGTYLAFSGIVTTLMGLAT